MMETRAITEAVWAAKLRVRDKQRGQQRGTGIPKTQITPMAKFLYYAHKDKAEQIDKICKLRVADVNRFQQAPRYDVDEVAELRDAAMVCVMASKQASKMLRLASDSGQLEGPVQQEEVAWEFVVEQYGPKCAQPGDTALHVAAKSGSIAAIAALRRGHANLEALDAQGRTALQLAKNSDTKRALTEDLEGTTEDPGPLGDDGRSEPWETRNAGATNGDEAKAAERRKEAVFGKAMEAKRREGLKKLDARSKRKAAKELKKKRQKDAQERAEKLKNYKPPWSWIGGKPIWAGGPEYENQGYAEMVPPAQEPEMYPEAQKRRAAQKQPKDNMQLHKRRPAAAPSGIMHQQHTELTADEVLRAAEEVQRATQKQPRKASRAAMAAPDEQLRFYPSVTAPHSREGMQFGLARNGWTDPVENYPPEMLAPSGTWRGAQAPGAQRPTPRRWVLPPDEAAAVLAAAPQGTSEASGPAPLCEHYAMVKAGKAAGQGSQLGKLHWNRAKVSRELPDMGDWSTQKEFNDNPVSRLWDERARGMSHPEIDIDSAAETAVRVKAQEEAREAAEAEGQKNIPRGGGGQGFTYTEYPWAVPDPGDPDNLPAGADGHQTTEVLMAHGDYYKCRGEFDRAKSCYDAGMASLTLPPDSSVDWLITAIANPDDTVDEAGLSKFLDVTGAEHPGEQAAEILSGKTVVDRTEFTELLGGWVEDHPSELQLMTRIGSGRLGKKPEANGGNRMWSDPPHLARLTKAASDAPEGSAEQRDAMLLLKEARRAWKFDGVAKLNTASKELKLLQDLGYNFESEIEQGLVDPDGLQGTLAQTVPLQDGPLVGEAVLEHEANLEPSSSNN